MNGSSDNKFAPKLDGTERRTRPHLRDVFEQAYRVAYPMLDSQQIGSAHFIRVVLHDAFPDLHLQDIAILSVAIERVYRERGKEEN
jgi:hypothetical protein